MTQQNKPPRCTDREVSEYLREHPDFFTLHPDVLAALEVSHHTASGTVSLIERQVQVMREEARQLRGRIKELVGIARENDTLMAKLHHLYLDVLAADDLDAFVTSLRQCLAEDFKVDRVAIALFNDVSDDDQAQVLRFERSDERLRVFETVLKRRKPVCGRYHHDQMRVLFGLEAEKIGSMAVLPLVGEDMMGLIALGSADKDRFRAGMSMVFLGYMTEMISALLKQQLAKTVSV